MKKGNAMVSARNQRAKRYGEWVRRGSASMAKEIPDAAERLQDLALAEARERVHDYGKHETGP